MLSNLTELQEAFAFELGKESPPAQGSAEWNKRRYFLNKGYLTDVIGRNLWWFILKTQEIDSVANQREYSFASDFRAPFWLTVDGIDYDLVTFWDARQILRSGWGIVGISSGEGSRNKFYINDVTKKLGLLPALGSNGSKNIILDYFYQVLSMTNPTDPSGGIVIPEPYRPVIVHAGLVYYHKARGEDTDAQDQADMARDIFEEMLVEQDRRIKALTRRKMKDPDSISSAS